ncbi:FecR family protein [Novosphingobium sp. BL-52-GroH]|uniref:FecR family protein n=1 Tax=Novosphingobium sp. BL-52-GroH TaxID=3349877 RepID=UPI00384D2BB6
MMAFLTRRRITRRDRADAQRWVMLMLDEPDTYAQGLADWLARKPVRREYYLGLLETIDTAARASALMSMSKVSPKEPGKLSRIWNDYPVLSALGLLVPVGAVTWIALHTFDMGAPGLVDEARAQIFTTRIGEVRTEELGDGTSLVLDTDTQARVAFSKDERVIEIARGRARITAAPDPERPLIVRLGAFTVEPTGRVFDVSMRGTVSIAAIEGGLDVRAPEDAAPRPIPVRAGEVLVLSGHSAGPPAPHIARVSDGQWVKGTKSYDDALVNEIIAEANTYSRTRLELADPSLGERRVLADIDIRDIHRVADALAGFLNLEIDDAEPGRIVLRTRR